MRKRSGSTLIKTLAAFLWLGLGSWAYYTRNPVIEWIFISMVAVLITVTVIDAVKNYTPRHYRRRKSS